MTDSGRFLTMHAHLRELRQERILVGRHQSLRCWWKSVNQV